MIANAPQLPVITPASRNPANEVAQRITGRPYVSWSAISTFRNCPLKYKFRYIDGLPEESVSAALIFGTGIHTAVEQHFQAILSGEEQPDVERLMFAYRSAWHVKRTLAGVERVRRAIESGVFYPAPSPMNCSGCGYRAACRAWAG